MPEFQMGQLNTDSRTVILVAFGEEIYSACLSFSISPQCSCFPLTSEETGPWWWREPLAGPASAAAMTPLDEKLSGTPSHYRDQGPGDVQRANADALPVSAIDVFPEPVQQCVEFFLKSERPAGSSLLFLNPFPC